MSDFTELDKKYQQLTGLNYSISDLISNVSDEDKEKLYNKLEWDIPAGLIRDIPERKALFDSVIAEIQSSLGIESSEIVDIDTVINEKPQPTENTESEQSTADNINEILLSGTKNVTLSEGEVLNNLEIPAEVNVIPNITGEVKDGATITNNSPKAFTLTNTSEEPVSITVESSQSVYLKGKYEDVYLDGTSIAGSSSTYPDIYGTVTIDEDIPKKASVSANFHGNACVESNTSQDISVSKTNNDKLCNMNINTPNSTVTLNGKFNNVNATVSENTLIISKNSVINHLKVNQGNVLLSLPSLEDINDVIHSYEPNDLQFDYLKLDVNNANSAKLTSTNELTLVEDITRTASLVTGTFSTDYMIWKLNGHSITIGEGNRSGVILLRNSAKLRVDGDGEIRNETGYGLWLAGVNTHAIINGGRWYAQTHVLYAESGTIEVHGGEFHCVNTEDPKFLLNCLDENYANGKAKIIVSGGKFYGFNPAVSMSEPNGPVSFLAEGYESVEIEPGVFEVVKIN